MWIDALLHFEGSFYVVNIWRGLYVLAKTLRHCLASAYNFKTVVGVYLSAAKLSLNRGAAMENMEKTFARCPCFTRQGEVFA